MAGTCQKQLMRSLYLSRPQRHAITITSPATSKRSDAAVDTSDLLDDVPYVFEEGADEDERGTDLGL